MIAYGIFHGDLHAGNVLINSAGDFSLIDFGIAGRIDAEQRAATVKFLFGFAQNDTRPARGACRRSAPFPPGRISTRWPASSRRHRAVRP